jgi:hypothetical protein
MKDCESRLLEQLADEYIRKQSKQGAVSVAGAMRAVLDAVGECPVAASELERLIVVRALGNGHSVVLDGCIDCLPRPVPTAPARRLGHVMMPRTGSPGSGGSNRYR